MYFKNRTYYKISLNQSEALQVDQNLTEDIEKLTDLFVNLYSQITKPLLDITLITITLINLAKKKNVDYILSSTMGILVISLTGLLLRYLSPKFGRLVAEEAKKKGYLRYLYTRVQINSEEIAFYGGENKEIELIQKAYKDLKVHLEKIYLSKLWYIFIEQFLMKYIWSAGMVHK
jgi:ABC-type uncharacterized transport system fused permease/ATPase subunit